MRLDELIEWVEQRTTSLAAVRMNPARRLHIEQWYGRLRGIGCDWNARGEWHALATLLANSVGAPRPAPPEPPPPWLKRSHTTSEPLKALPLNSRKRDPQRSHRAEAPLKKVAAKPSTVEMTAGFQATFDAVRAGRMIVFITGGAGTGKSTLIRELRTRFKDKAPVILAPTGVAALNVGAQTIHSFCSLPLRPFVPGAEVDAHDGELIRKLKLVVIDEISMVRADTLDGLDAFLRRNRRSSEPFGGVQVVLVGDLFQLPPVATGEDREAIDQRYSSIHFFAAHALKGRSFFPIVLDKVFRQRDESFASLLNAFRDGVGAADAVRVLNQECVGRKLTGPHLVLVPTRKAADAENLTRLTQLAGTGVTFPAGADGTFSSTGREDRLPAPRVLILKPNMQVMFVRNDPERRWVNGTVGTVTSLRKRRVTVRLDSGPSYEIERVEWQDIKYSFDPKTKEVTEEVAGTFRQLPLMPAWAVTIHKAQGLTLDRVSVDFDRGVFAPGQAYVALSRCQRMEGLSLKRPLRIEEVQVSAAAREFHSKISAPRLR